MERVQHGEEEDARRADRGRDVAEDVDLGSPRPLRPVAQAEGDAAGLEGGPHRPADVDVPAAAAARALVPEGGDAALQLGDHPMHGGQVLRRTGRQRAVELGERP